MVVLPALRPMREGPKGRGPELRGPPKVGFLAAILAGSAGRADARAGAGVRAPPGTLCSSVFSRRNPDAAGWPVEATADARAVLRRAIGGRAFAANSEVERLSAGGAAARPSGVSAANADRAHNS